MSSHPSPSDLGNQSEVINPHEAQDILQHAPIGIFKTSPEGRYLYANQTLARMYGYGSPQELMDSITDIAGQLYVDPSDREEFMRLMEKQGQVVNHECRVRGRDGSEFWVSRNVQAIKDHKGRVVAYQGFNTDITARKRTEEALRESQEKYQLLIDNLNEGIWQIDQDGYTVFVNERMAEMLGYTVQEMQGNHLFDFMDEQEAQLTKNYMQRRQEGIKEQHEHVLICKDGSYIFTSLETSPIYDKDGKHIGALAGVQDITERKQAEKALRESEVRFRTVLESLPGGIFTHDLDGRLLLVNKAACQNSGYSREELLQMSVQDIDPHAVTRDDHSNLWQELEKGQSVMIESTHIRKDGSQYPVEIYMNAITLDGQPVILAIAFDVSKRKKFEQALRESEQQFKTLFIESPVSIVIHDKNNGEIIDANPQALASYGLSSVEEMNSRGIWMEPPYSYTDALGWIRKAATEGPQQFEWLNRNIYGELFWEQVRLIPIPITGVERVVATTVDITELKQAEEALRQSENYYRAIFETSGSAMFIMENDTTISHVNSYFEKLTGYSSQEIEGRTSWTELVHPDDLKWMKEYHYLRRQDPDAAPRQYEFRFMTRFGECRALFFTVDMIPGTNQSIGSGIDITERKQAEEELRKREEHLQAILQATPDPLVVYDSIGHPQYISPSFSEVFGWTMDELRNRRVPFVPEDQKELTFSKIQEIYRTGTPVKFDTKRLTKNDRLLDIRVSAAIIRSAMYEHYGLVVHLTDITERKQLEHKLQRMSLHDSLTGLYNRNFFEEEMKRLSDGRHNPLGIIVCDVDGLKSINDTLGHLAGDQVLINTADILRQSFRSSDIIARIGGDEFAILLTETEPEMVEVMLQRLRQAVEDFNSNEPEIPVSLSMGHALGEGAMAEMQALFREADHQMYREKIQRE